MCYFQDQIAFLATTFFVYLILCIITIILPAALVLVLSNSYFRITNYPMFGGNADQIRTNALLLYGQHNGAGVDHNHVFCGSRKLMAGV